MAAADSAGCLVCWGRPRGDAAETLRSTAQASAAAPDAPAEDGLLPEQRARLADLRALLGPGTAATADGQRLLRFLRARRWDPAAAREQLEAEQRWREEGDVDRVRRLAPGPLGAEVARAAACDPRLSEGGVECFPELRLVEPLDMEGVWRRLSPVAYFGHDRIGRPIFLQRTGVASCHFPEMLRLFGASAITAGFVRLQEVQAARMAEASALLGRPVTSQVIIMDLAGMAWKPHPRSIQLLLEQVSIGARYYPETLGLHIFLNAPWAFSAVWRVIRPALDPTTASKMRVLGTDYREELLRHIEPGQLPRELGGTNGFGVLWAPLGSGELQQLLDRHRAAYAEGVACAGGVARARGPKGGAAASRGGVAPPSALGAGAPAAGLARLFAVALAALACACWLLAALC